MRLTLVHPSIGHRIGEKYIRTWQMEPLAPAVLAGLTPRDVDVKFYDDRMEEIPYDESTDLVAISVETYTARRAYEIATEYRRRGVPVVMGDFHATLVPDEVAEYAESVVIGEAEGLWPQVIEDTRAHRLQPVYRAPKRPSLAGAIADRSIFLGKRYAVGTRRSRPRLPLACEFCAIQSVFASTQTRRPAEEVCEEAQRMKKPLYFS
jgi:radical SAM superfamily enzyme YgiQ (UPF0313 family)